MKMYYFLSKTDILFLSNCGDGCTIVRYDNYMMDQRSSGSVRCWQRRWRGRIVLLETVRSGGVTAYSRNGMAWETLYRGKTVGAVSGGGKW